MGIRNFQVISIGETRGLRTANVSLTAAKVAIPTMSNGALPKYLHCVAAGGTALNFITIIPTHDTVGDVATGLPIFNDNPYGVILNVHGYSHIGTEAAGVADSDLYLYPLEDF